MRIFQEKKLLWVFLKTDKPYKNSTLNQQRSECIDTAPKGYEFKKKSLVLLLGFTVLPLIWMLNGICSMCIIQLISCCCVVTYCMVIMRPCCAIHINTIGGHLKHTKCIFFLHSILIYFFQLDRWKFDFL